MRVAKREREREAATERTNLQIAFWKLSTKSWVWEDRSSFVQMSKRESNLKESTLDEESGRKVKETRVTREWEKKQRKREKEDSWVKRASCASECISFWNPIRRLSSFVFLPVLISKGFRLEREWERPTHTNSITNTGSLLCSQLVTTTNNTQGEKICPQQRRWFQRKWKWEKNEKKRERKKDTEREWERETTNR